MMVFLLVEGVIRAGRCMGGDVSIPLCPPAGTLVDRGVHLRDAVCNSAGSCISFWTLPLLLVLVAMLGSK